MASSYNMRMVMKISYNMSKNKKYDQETLRIAIERVKNKELTCRIQNCMVFLIAA